MNAKLIAQSIFATVTLWLIFSAPVMADEEPFVKIKRPALWVPDLDRAIIFYRDVLGFTLVSQGELNLEPDSVVFDLFNAEPSLNIPRAMFSTSAEKNALFVMQAEGAPIYEEGEKRNSTLVIQTDDLDGVVARAKKNGFEIGVTDIDISEASGTEFRETVIYGPGGQSALLYQFVKLEEKR